MSALWVLPLVVLAVGAVAVAVAARRLAAEVAAATPALASLRDLSAEAAAVRADVDAARVRGAALGAVPDRFRAGRTGARRARLGGTDR